MQDTATETLAARNPRDAMRWTALVEGSGQSDVYYLPEYACASAEVEQTEPVAMIAGSSSSRILAPLLIRRMSAKTNGSRVEWLDAATPYGYGGILKLASPNIADRSALQCFVEQLRSWCSRREIVCCVIRLHPLFEQQDWFAAKEDWRDFPQTHLRGLTSSVQLYEWDEKLNRPQGMRRDRRADMNLADRELHATWVGGEDRNIDHYLDIFCSLYYELLDRHAADNFYRFPASYFGSLLRLGDKMGISIAWREERPVGANLFFAGIRFAHGHLAGVNEEGRKYGASTMMIVEGARWARQRGRELLHLGGGMHPGDALEDYKRSFGGPTHRYAYMTCVIDQDKFQQICSLSNAPWPYNIPSSLATESHQRAVP